MTSPRTIANNTFATSIWLLVLAGAAILVFSALMSSDLDRSIALRTIGLGLSASLIAVPIGGATAWVCMGRGFVSRLLLIACLAMLLVPMLIHVSGWDAAFGKLGWLTATKGQALDPLVSGWTAASWIHGIAAVPQVAVILLIGFAAGRRVYEEQALLDTGSWGVFWNVTFKRIYPVFLLSVLWIVISCAREIAVTDLYQIGTLAEQIYLGYSLGLNAIAGNWSPEQLAEANAMGPNLTIIIVGWLTLTAICMFMTLAQLELRSSDLIPRTSGRKSWFKAIVGLALFAVMVAAPMINVITRACFFVRPVDGVPTKGYSFSQLIRAIKRSVVDYQNEFMWSFVIALTSAVLILIISTILAALARRSRIWQWALIFSLSLCCALPGPYIGTIVGKLFTSFQSDWIAWLYNYTIAAPVVANFLFCWPLGALIVWLLFRSIPQDVIESSSLEGAGSVNRMLTFGLAANWLSFIGAFFVIFAICFGELSASQIVRPAGMDTVPRKMLGDLHAGVNELTAGITIVITFTIVGISLVGWYFIWLNRGRRGRQY